MKIGFSSLACPSWGLERIIKSAAEIGFDSVELRGLSGELHLPLVPELARDPAGVRTLFSENKVQLVCLGSSATLDAKNDRDAANQKAALIEIIELAGQLGCPYVRILVGEVQRLDNRRAAIARIAKRLIAVAPTAAHHGVIVLVENGGDFTGSTDLWFLIDAVGHPSIKCCWNQMLARTGLERPTVSIPRLGRHIGLVHICDADFDEQGVLLAHKPMGEGHAEVARQIELLRGIAYNGHVVFEWPRLWFDLAAPETVLPAAAKFLRAKISEKQTVLSAYKGDKNAPKLTRPTMGIA